jgi:hypothetical protein
MAAPVTLVTTVVRSRVRALISAVVGAVVAYATAKWGKLDVGLVAVIFPVVTGAYYVGITALEKKFPGLGWLLGAFPQPKKPVVLVPPPVKPVPVPAPTPAAGRKAGK